ncbi:MAG: hypothetical protein J0H14_18135 [Alphaproteobacteria bacterium]|nr:hypothetical protein [Alphaproteobacteria bacterium]
MMRALVVVAILLALVAGCAQVQGVSTRHSTNVAGAPGTANDPATGGRDWPW